jgi:opacity protein-like surface antigen
MNIKSLLFGSAAVLAAGTGAQAADLPVAEPVEYVRICDAFGTGFYYIPGTDTCLRVSGRVRVEAHYVDEFGDDDDDDDDDDGDFFGINQNTNNYTTRARGNMRLDARTQTDIGLVRAFIDFQLTVGPGASSEPNPNYDNAGADLSAAFIQISNDMGTFTAGHTGSFFDFFGSYGFGTRINIDDNTTEQTLFAYTFGGDPFSATISLEDPASSGRRLNGEEDYEGQEWPDLVGNVRFGGDWGSAQIMGVLHHIHDKEDVDPVEGPDDEDELGWAVGAGAQFGLGGLEISAQGGWAEPQP